MLFHGVWRLCFTQMLMYTGFFDIIYGEIYIWRLQWIWVQMGIRQPHKGQMQPIVPKCYQTHMFWGSFFRFDPHCVYVARVAISDKHILWLGLRLLSSTGLPVQSDWRNSYLKNHQCHVNRTIANFYIDSLFCTLQNCDSRAQVSIQTQCMFELCCLLLFVW